MTAQAPAATGAGHSEMCATHPASRARWWCGRCRRGVCGDCIREEFVEGRWVRLCRECGQPCADLAAVIAAAEKRTFAQEIVGAFAYPLRGRGLYLILAGSAFIMIAGGLRTLAIWLIPGPYARAYIGLVVRGVFFIIGLIVPAYLVEVIDRSATGEDEPPDWPAVRNWREDLLQPFVWILAAVAVAFLPAVAARILVAYELIPSVVLWAAVAVGAFFFPMSMLATIMFEGWRGLNPLIVFPAIWRTMPAYLLPCAVVGGTVLAGCTRRCFPASRSRSSVRWRPPPACCTC
jgi:hypothetical protein